MKEAIHNGKRIFIKEFQGDSEPIYVNIQTNEIVIGLRNIQPAKVKDIMRLKHYYENCQL